MEHVESHEPATPTRRWCHLDGFGPCSDEESRDKDKESSTRKGKEGEGGGEIDGSIYMASRKRKSGIGILVGECHVGSFR